MPVDKLVHMISLPSHGRLNYQMKPVKANITRHNHSTPDWRMCVLEGDFDLEQRRTGG
jgi:hypothetical protein